MFVMIICAFLYHNSISYVENRTSISENANVLAKDLLDSRISVYQFMLETNIDKRDKVIENFETLSKNSAFKWEYRINGVNFILPLLAPFDFEAFSNIL